MLPSQLISFGKIDISLQDKEEEREFVSVSL
jgi:hypothetical protein